MNRGKVALLNSIHDSAHLAFREGGYEVITVSASALKDNLHPQIQDAIVLGIRSGNTVPEELLGEMPHLLAIGAFCIGTNQVDLSPCSKRRIPVFH